MVLGDALLLLIILLMAVLFWQSRRQAEYARRRVENYCKKHQLQFLDIAWQGGRPAKRGRYIGWLSRYEFGFSSDGESRYVGQAVMLNLRLLEVNTPPYRLPDA